MKFAYFHVNGFALNLALKKRLRATRNDYIIFAGFYIFFCFVY